MRVARLGAIAARYGFRGGSLSDVGSLTAPRAPTRLIASAPGTGQRCLSGKPSASSSRRALKSSPKPVSEGFRKVAADAGIRFTEVTRELTVTLPDDIAGNGPAEGRLRRIHERERGRAHCS